MRSNIAQGQPVGSRHSCFHKSSTGQPFTSCTPKNKMRHQQLYWSCLQNYTQSSHSCCICSNCYHMIQKYGLSMCHQFPSVVKGDRLHQIRLSDHPWVDYNPQDNYQMKEIMLSLYSYIFNLKKKRSRDGNFQLTYLLANVCKVLSMDSRAKTAFKKMVITIVYFSIKCRLV